MRTTPAKDVSKTWKTRPRAPAVPPPQDLTFSSADIAEIQAVIVREARQGNLEAIAIVERIWRHRRRTTTLDLPPVDDARGLAAAQAAVIEAAAAGRITAYEGMAYAAMLDYRRRALDTIELEGRLREIEQENEERERRAKEDWR